MEVAVIHPEEALPDTLDPYEKIGQSIALAESFNDLAQVNSQLEALRLAAKRARSTLADQNGIARLHLHWSEKVGLMRADVPNAPRGKTQKTNNKSFGKTAADSEVGISKTTGQNCEKIAAIPEEEKSDYYTETESKEQPITIKGLLNYHNRVTKQADQDKADVEAVKAASEIVHSQILVGDFREKASIIPDESVDLVFIDPPYDRKAIPLYGDAAKEAARILKPGGSLICYTGQIILYDVQPAMAEYLRYWWTGAVFHSGPALRMNEYGIRNGWKPLLWFVKGTRGDKVTFIDDVVTGGREKSHHKWQQAESEAAHWIENLAPADGLVVDFFCGGGTTAVAAQKLKRNWLAFEIDPVAAKASQDRINDQAV